MLPLSFEHSESFKSFLPRCNITPIKTEAMEVYFSAQVIDSGGGGGGGGTRL